MTSIVKSIPLTTTYCIRSDNASHPQCAPCFTDLQSIADEFNVTIIRVYRIASHGKGAIDSAGGRTKNAVRKSIASVAVTSLK